MIELTQGDLNIIAIVVPLMYLTDIAFTYFSAKKMKKFFPEDKKWAEIEANPIVRWFWKKFGLNAGTLVCASLFLPIVILIMYLVKDSQFYAGLVLGMYGVVFLAHFQSFRLIYQKEKEIESGI